MREIKQLLRLMGLMMVYSAGIGMMLHVISATAAGEWWSAMTAMAAAASLVFLSDKLRLRWFASSPTQEP